MLKKQLYIVCFQISSPLVPVFGFREIDLFQQYNSPGTMMYKIQMKVKKLMGYALIWPYGRGLFSSSGFVPFKEPVTVVGKLFF